MNTDENQRESAGTAECDKRINTFWIIVCVILVITVIAMCWNAIYVKNGQTTEESLLNGEVDEQTKSKTMEDFLKINIHSKEIVDIEIRNEKGDLVAAMKNVGVTFGFDRLDYAYHILKYDNEGMHMIVYLPNEGHTVTLVDNSEAGDLFERADLEVKVSVLTPDGYNRTSVTFRQQTEEKNEFIQKPADERILMVFDLLEQITEKTLENMQADSQVPYEKTIEYHLTE